MPHLKNMFQLILLCTSIGVASHLAFFIRREHHLQAGTLLRLYLLAAGITWLANMQLNEVTPWQAVVSSTNMVLSYCLGLFASMVIYRLCFHRLHSFPGPIGARLSKLWHVWQVLDAKQYLILDDLHKKYGDFVRTGKLSIQGRLQ